MNNTLPKVFLAIGMKGMEEFIKKQLKDDFKFVGEAIYKEAIVNNALHTNPDIIIIRETLNGSKSILDVVYEIRLQLPDSRIIFLASDRKPGDTLLAELVGNGVYDIMTGNKLSVPDLINLMREPNKFSDVAMYRPKVSINSKTKEAIFEAPAVKEIVKQVEKTIFVEGEVPTIASDTQGKSSSTTELTDDEPNSLENAEVAEEQPKKPKRKKRRFLKGKSKSVKNKEIPKEVTKVKDESPKIVEKLIPKEVTPVVEEIPEPIEEELVIEEPIEEENESIVETESFEEETVEETEPEQVPIPEPILPKVDLNMTEDVEPMKENVPDKIIVPEPIPQPIPDPIPAPKIETPPQEEYQPQRVITPIPKPTIPEPKQIVETFNPLNGKQKILSFIGGDHGVGNSQVAFNTALALGKRGFKTIYIELKEQGSTIEYLYQLALVDKGLDYALDHLSNENFAGLESSIIKMNDVRSQNRNQILAESYNQFPSIVDYLFFSPDYVLESDKSKKHIEPSQLKELCMHLFFQMGYHYIVLDTEPNLFHEFSEVALGFGTHVFYTLTQDVCHIGRAVRNISEINKRINITDKLYYIVNKFDDHAALSKKDIEDWLKADVDAVIPMKNKDFINANMNAKPVILYSQDKQLRKSFEQVVNHILKN